MHFACYDTRGTSLFDCECCITTTATTTSKTITTTQGKQQSCHMLASASRPNIMQACLTFLSLHIPLHPCLALSLRSPCPFATSFPIEIFVVTATGKTVFHIFIFIFTFFCGVRKTVKHKNGDSGDNTHKKRRGEKRGGKSAEWGRHEQRRGRWATIQRCSGKGNTL